jgi:hypothetical protein
VEVLVAATINVEAVMRLKDSLAEALPHQRWKQSRQWRTELIFSGKLLRRLATTQLHRSPSMGITLLRLVVLWWVPLRVSRRHSTVRVRWPWQLWEGLAAATAVVVVVVMVALAAAAAVH